MVGYYYNKTEELLEDVENAFPHIKKIKISCSDKECELGFKIGKTTLTRLNSSGEDFGKWNYTDNYEDMAYLVWGNISENLPKDAEILVTLKNNRTMPLQDFKNKLKGYKTTPDDIARLENSVRNMW